MEEEVEWEGWEVKRCLSLSSRSCFSLSFCFRADRMGKCYREREDISAMEITY